MLLKLVLGFHRPGSSYSKRGKPQQAMAIYYCPVIRESKTRKEKEERKGRKEGKREGKGRK